MFDPVFAITSRIVQSLMRIEAVKHAIEALPITPRVLVNLRETARLFSTHYSTLIEGNRLTQEQVTQVIRKDQHFPGRERDEDEVRGYYAALDQVDLVVRTKANLTETAIRKLHALAMGGGKTRVKPTPYRDGQNVIKVSRGQQIVYLPPEAADVPLLMKDLVGWIARSNLPAPIKAAVAHYQFATVHPYYDGNGRTARLLTTMILHLGDYGLKGLYALEEYYARDLAAYYKALTVGPSHNYYVVRAESDITGWVEYFIEGLAVSFEKVRDQATREGAAGARDQSRLLRNLDAKQRKALGLFQESCQVSAKAIAELLHLQARTATAICGRWVSDGFLVVANPSRKARRYRLADVFEEAFYGA